MQKSKKNFTLVMAVIMVVSVALTGCGTKDSSASDSTASASTSTTAAVSTQEQLAPVELTWYLPCNPQKDTDKVNEELNKILKDKINATVTLNYLDFATFKDKSSVMIAAGDKFDILFTASWMLYRQNVAKGAFVDITDLIDKYMPKTKELLHPAFLEGSKVDGKNYAVPTNKELAHTYGFLYRDDIAKKYNLDLSGIKSYGELEAFLKVIKEKEPDMYPLQGFVNTNPVELLDFDPVGDVNTPGVLYPGKDTKVINVYETPEAMEILKIQHQYYKAGYIRKDAATVKDKNPDQNAGKNFITTGTLKPLVADDYTLAVGFPFKVVELTKPFITGNDAQGSMQAISRTSNNPERALMFLELVNTDAGVNNLINYGIENVHYIKKSDNVIAFAQGLDAKTSGYFPNNFWVFGNQFLNYFMEGQNTSKWDLYRSFNEKAVSSKILGFAFNSEPVKTELAACANVYSEFGPGLGTGTLDPEASIPKFLEKLKAAGADKIIAEKQKQLDAWLAAK